MKKYIYPIAMLFLIIGSVGCENNTVIEGGHDHSHDHGGGGDIAQLTREQIINSQIKLGSFEEMNLGNSVKCNGILELPPQNKASVSALLGGRVKDIKVIEGDVVSKGQVLAVLETQEIIVLQEDYLDVYNNLSVLKSDFERKQKLLADNITSKKAFEEAESAYQSALGKLNAISAKLKLLGISPSQVEKGNITSSSSILSPIDGYVRLVEINLGKFIEPQQEMFEIVDNDHIHIDLMVYEQDINQIKMGQTVQFALTSDPLASYTGKVFAVGKAFEEDTKAVRVHAEIDHMDSTNHVAFLPGMFVNALIQTNKKQVTALPNEAIITEGEDSYIFIQLEDDPHVGHNHDDHSGHDHGHDGDDHAHEAPKTSFQRISVMIGASQMGFTEIKNASEIPNKGNIVIQGAYHLDAQLKKGMVGHDH